MCSSVDYWRCRWIKLGGALEYPQRGPSDPHPGPDLSTACPQGYPQGWREDPQGVENGARRCGDAHISPRRRRGRRRAGPTGRSASRSPCGRAGPAPPLRLWLTAALPRHRSPRAVPSARSRWARSPVRHPLAPGPRDQVRQLGPRGEHGTRSLPGRAVRSKPWESIRDGREPQGRRPVSAPSGRPSRPGCSMVDIVGVLSRTRIGSELEGLPAQRGRGQAGGRRCMRGRRHTRPVRPVRLGAGTGGPVAERSGDSKRWPARIFHPRPVLLPSRNGAMTPFPGRAGAAAHPKVTRRPPFSAPPTLRAATAGPPEASTAPGPSSAPARPRRRGSPAGRPAGITAPSRVRPASAGSAPMLSRPHRPGVGGVGRDGISGPVVGGGRGRPSGADRAERGRFRRPPPAPAPPRRRVPHGGTASRMS